MSDIKLFRLSEGKVREIPAHYAQLEKNLHNLMEKNLESFLGVRFLAREHGTGRIQRGHIDSLGLDENNCPVIIEYKRGNNESLISQGLYYLNWLMDHQGDFCLLVREKLGPEVAEQIEFAGTRVICIASGFSRYDEQAILQIDRNIELIRYRLFEDDLLVLEMLNTAISPFMGKGEREGSSDVEAGASRTVGMPVSLQTRIKNMGAEAELLYLDLLSYAETLGDDVNIKFLKHYVALTRFKNFTSIQPLKNSLKLWVNLEPEELTLEEGFSRNVRDIGHHSTGNLELEIHNMADLAKAKPLIDLAYQKN